jgi:hypothetical protein
VGAGSGLVLRGGAVGGDCGSERRAPMSVPVVSGLGWLINNLALR